MPTVTRLERQKKNPERVNVYLDDEFAFGLSEMDAVPLRKGQELSDEQIAVLREQDTMNKAVEQGLRFLSYRPRSTHEVRQALLKQQDEAVVEAAIARLTTMGYLDDEAFARFWMENRSTFKPLSSRALRFELRAKGVAAAIIQTVLETMVEDDAALAAARSQLRRLRGRPQAAFEQHLLVFLQRRGFAYSTARQAIRTLEEQLRDVEPGFFAQ